MSFGYGESLTVFFIEKSAFLCYILNGLEENMIVVSYSDFFANPAKFKDTASRYGLKVLPQEKQKKISRRIQKKLDSLNAAAGLIPSKIDAEKILTARKTEK